MDLYQGLTNRLSIVAESNWVTITALILSSLFLSTYVTTTIKSMIALRSRKAEKEPPIFPYFLPLLGNSISFARDPAGFVASIT